MIYYINHLVFNGAAVKMNTTDNVLSVIVLWNLQLGMTGDGVG